jgi:hypothetical protein
VKRSRRQVLALIVLVIAGLASLATETAPGLLSQEPTDRLSFKAGQTTEVRHVRMEIVSAAGQARVWVDIPIEIGSVNGKRPVTLTVIRDRDGKAILDDFGPDYHAGSDSSLAGSFEAIASCAPAKTCSETFTFTFERIPEDTRPSLAFDWSVRASATYYDLATPPRVLLCM